MNLVQKTYKRKVIKVGTEFTFEGTKCRVTSVGKTIRFQPIQIPHKWRHVNGYHLLTYSFIKDNKNIKGL